MNLYQNEIIHNQHSIDLNESPLMMDSFKCRIREKSARCEHGNRENVWIYMSRRTTENCGLSSTDEGPFFRAFLEPVFCRKKTGTMIGWKRVFEIM